MSPFISLLRPVIMTNDRPESGFRLRFILQAIMAASALAFCGCATYGPTSAGSQSAVYIPPAGLSHSVAFSDEAVSFSDEVSRDLVRQTRKLIDLRDTDYLVGADDVLEISIFEWELSEQTKTLEFRVAESGVISLPVAGVLDVAGQTVQDVQKTIEKALLDRGVLQNPRVGVSVKEFRSRRIAVIGAVNSPGVYAIHENVSTLMDMLTMAGGPNQGAGQRVYVLRKAKGESEPLRIVVDLEDLLDRGSFDMNPVLQGGDIVYLPQAPLIYVYGNVRAPGGFGLHRSTRVIEALALAGGLSTNADKRNCALVRREHGSSSEQVVPVDVKAIERGEAPNFYLREGDVLHVPESSSKALVSELWGVLRGIFTFTYRLDS